MKIKCQEHYEKTIRYHKEAGKKATWFAEVKNFSGNRGII